MINKLLPEQIAKLWDVIAYAVEESLPPTVGEHPDKMNRILTAALSGKIDVWASYTKGETNKFEGIVLTQVLYDEASGTRNLLIYTLYSYDNVSKKSWFEGISALAKYAKSKGCINIVAFSSVNSIVELSKRLGADTSFTYISFNVKQIVENFNGLDKSED